MTRTKGKRHLRYIAKASILTLAMLMATALYSQTAYAAETTETDEEAPVITEFVTTANLNLRRGPATSYYRIALLPRGTVVVVTNFDPYGFSAVSVNNMSGFVSSEFIRPIDNTTQPETTTSTTQRNGNIEKLPWRDMRQIMPTGTRIHVYDVRTSRTFYIRNFSNGNHADVEPINAQDTETLRAIYGGRWSWDARPVLVTFNGRTFAAAINGMPHGGSTISGNNFNGHICLHFYRSTTHNGNRRYEATMQAAVREAFNSAR
ncbi:MAG: hypothetical protein FWC93_01290 [Defluviitaleaceae bacterium]|nr:hypothetical protein [Defluviitaleaceae bacterium]